MSDSVNLISEIEVAAEIAEGTLKGDEKLTDLEGWDSMAMLNLISAVDIKLGVYLEMDEFEKCETVNEIVAYVEKVISEEG